MIKVAQFGCGYWGPNLLRNLINNPDCELKYLIDTSKERREFVSKQYPNIIVSDNIDPALNDTDVDAIIIATPVATHYDLAIKALEAGKHILVEKPMASSVKEVEAIAEIAHKQKLVAMVGHTFLYNAAVRHLKKIIQNGDLGDIRYILSQRLNLGRIRSDVDALWNFAPHDISIIQYLLDNPTPEHVSCQGMDYVQEGINDVSFLNIVYPGKILANIHVSWLDPRKVRRMLVVGSKKMAIYDDIADEKIAIYDKGIDRMAVLGENMDFDKPGFTLRSGDVHLPKINFTEPLKEEIAHFFDCITNKTPCLTDTAHAKSVIHILEQASKK